VDMFQTLVMVLLVLGTATALTCQRVPTFVNAITLSQPSPKVGQKRRRNFILVVTNLVPHKPINFSSLHPSFQLGRVRSVGCSQSIIGNRQPGQHRCPESFSGQRRWRPTDRSPVDDHLLDICLLSREYLDGRSGLGGG